MTTQITIGEYGIEVVEEKWNPLTLRKELTIIITHIAKSTPTRCEVREAVAKALNVPKELVVVTKILSEYGIGRTKVMVHVYKDKERLYYLEPQKVIKLNEQCG